MELPFEQLSALAASRETLIILDSAARDGDDRYSYVFTDPEEQLCAREPADVPRLLERLDAAGERWLCGYLAYEAAYGFGGRRPRAPAGTSPLGWFGVFGEPYVFDHASGRWNKPLPVHAAAPAHNVPVSLRLEPGITARDYARKIRTIRERIAAGDTYQVNFTFDVTARSQASALALYRSLRAVQPTRYCAFLRNRHETILSFSPELFFAMDGGKITVRPMKGTAPRSGAPLTDLRLRTELRRDAKNRAENLMIVDLMRNDLGRVCTTGSVSVKRLFSVETHPTLHQMTSTVTGTLAPGVSRSRVITSLFPCGSVTGAPKHRTMEIIRALEASPRGVYCGMLGYFAPRGKAVFSVPIRILQRKRRERSWRFRVGSGIVWDSSAEREWEECRHKYAFLTAPRPGRFELIESMLWDGARLTYARDHLSRLNASARFFRYPLGRSELDRIIMEIRSALHGRTSAKVRLLLKSDGTLRWESVQLGTGQGENPTVALAKDRIDEHIPFLYHKTTHRPWYRAAGQRISATGLFDIIFTNTRGELTEGTRSNIFIRKAGRLITPPVASGLLPGILRKRLLATGKCREAVLYPHDLETADEILCGNSVRGLVQVKLVK